MWEEISGGNELILLGKREVNSRGYSPSRSVLKITHSSFRREQRGRGWSVIVLISPAAFSSRQQSKRDQNGTD